MQPGAKESDPCSESTPIWEGRGCYHLPEPELPSPGPPAWAREAELPSPGPPAWAREAELPSPGPPAWAREAEQLGCRPMTQAQVLGLVPALLL